MKLLSRYLNLFKLFISYSFRQLTMYRADFFTWMLVTFGWSIFNIAFFDILFSQVQSIAGWTKGEVFILLGVYFLYEIPIWGLFYQNLRDFPERVTRGDLDMVLTKPINTQFLISFKNFSFDMFINLVATSYIFSRGFSLIGSVPTLPNILIASLVFVFGSIFFYSGYFITMCAVFWLGKIQALPHLFPQIRNFYKVPMAAYPTKIRAILTFWFPALLIGSLPTLALLGRVSWSLIAYFGLFSLLFLYLSTIIFKRAILSYSSASS